MLSCSLSLSQKKVKINKQKANKTKNKIKQKCQKLLSLFCVGQWLLGTWPSLEWLINPVTLQERKRVSLLPAGDHLQITPWLGVGLGATHPFQCWDVVRFEPAQVLPVLSRSLWDHRCVSSVVSGRCVSWESSPCLAFTVFPSFQHRSLSPEGRGFYKDDKGTPFGTECSKVSQSPHIVIQFWVSLLIPIYCKKLLPFADLSPAKWGDCGYLTYGLAGSLKGMEMG